MILQRLATSIRKQDWFTVLIETLIVVLGVFLGIQLGNWNAARQERGDEAATLERLHEETVAAIGYRTRYRELVTAMAADLYEVRKVFFGFAEPRSLTDAECSAITLSHFTPLPAGGIPALNELLASGRMNILRNEDIRAAAAALVQERDNLEVREGSGGTIAYDLPVQFPQYIAVGLTPTDDPDDVDGYAVAARCDAAAMMEDREFLNAFSSNVRQYNGYVVRTFNNTDPHYALLHELLDQELGIEHASEDAPAP